MAKRFFKLSGGDFLQNWSDKSLITATNVWDNVDAIVGYRGDGLASSGKDPRLVLTDGTNVVNVMANQTNPNTNTTGGIAEFDSLSDPTVALQGSGTAQAPNLVLYLDATGRQNLHFSVDLRDVDGSADNAIQQVAVQYRLGDSGNWTNLPGGYVADAASGPSLATLVTHLELDLPSAANNQSQVEIRILTCDAAGSDEWIGVDNIKVTSQAMAGDFTPPALQASVPADGGVGVAADANLTITFNELIQLGSGNIVITGDNGDTRAISVSDANQVSLSGQSIIINPAADLAHGVSYHVAIPAGAVLDLAGNAFGGTGSNPIDFQVIAALTPIYALQGAGHTSPYVGKTVATQGVVTAIDTTGTKGFWIQDPNGDGNVATSDAIFVSSSTAISSVHVGDLVSLQGVVVEDNGGNTNNLTITELGSINSLTVISSGNSVAATVIGDGGRLPPTEVVDSDNFGSFNPDHDAIDFYESLEGMLVTVKDAVAISSTSSGATFVLADNGASATGLNERGAVTRTQTDANPERIEIYADTGVNANVPAYTAGDKIGNVTGVMNYYGGVWEVLPTATPAAGAHNPVAQEVSSLHGDATHLLVAAYNLENCDPNDPQAKFDQIGVDIAKAMNGPDIIGLEEVQDSNGTGTGVLSADVTIGKILDAIVAAGGPHYAWVEVDPASENSTGGEPNGNIRNVILYNPDRVQYVNGTAHLLNDVTPDNGDSFNNSRHPLTADFMFRGEKVSYIGVHNYSRLGSDALFGVDQPPVNSGDARRADQNAAVQDYVLKLFDQDPGANIVVAGDFNGYQWEQAQTLLEGDTGLSNLVWKAAPADQYSSAYQGQNEQIDQLYVSADLAGDAAFDNVHRNTNQPAGVGASDHDPVLATVLINSGPLAHADDVQAAEDTALHVDAAHGVLANDTDVNGDALSAILMQGPSHGTLQFHADGSFDYQADANYNGADSFRYAVADALGARSKVVAVHLDVAAVNDAPTVVASAPSAALVEAGAAVAGVADAIVQLTRADIDSADTHYDTTGWTPLDEGMYTKQGQYGTVILDTVNDTLSYTLDNARADQLAGGAAVHDDFSVTVSDGALTASVPVSFAITGSNDAPTLSAGAPSADLVEAGQAGAGVSQSDIHLARADVDSATSYLSAGWTDTGNGLLSKLGVYGTAVLDTVHDTVRYTLDNTAADKLTDGVKVHDDFNVGISDGALTVSVPLSFAITGSNDAPTLSAGAPSADLVEAGLAGAGVSQSTIHLARADVDSATSYLSAGWTDIGNGLLSKQGGYGTAVLDTVHDTVSYTLDNARADKLADGVKAHDDFSVSISDGALTASAPLSFAITGSNDAPLAAGDSASVNEDASLRIDVLANDSDVDGDSLSIVLASATSAQGASLSLDNGQVRYTADADSFDALAAGQSVKDSFSYRVSDGHGGLSDLVTVNVLVKEAGDNQTLFGTNKDDSFTDGAGHDTTYSGGNGNDIVFGLDGSDTLNGDNGNDQLDGGDGADSLDGGNGDDFLFGGAGNDQLFGANGSDLLAGGAGSNKLSGGNGPDSFIISVGAKDTISDFSGEDKIITGYQGKGSYADVLAFANASHANGTFSFANADLDGNGSVDAVTITGGSLGTGSITLIGWSVESLVQQHLLNTGHQVIGNWLI